MKRLGYPYNPDTEEWYCTACKNAINEEADPHYHRCQICGYDFAPFGASLRVVMRKEGGRL